MTLNNLLTYCLYVHFCLQNALKNAEEECSHLQMMYQSSREELEQLVERSEEHIQEIRELSDKFQVYFFVSLTSRFISSFSDCFWFFSFPHVSS